MREIRTSGLMSGDVETERYSTATAPVLDSTSLMHPMSERDARGPEEYEDAPLEAEGTPPQVVRPRQ